MQSRRCLFFSQSLQVEEEVAARVHVKPMKVKSQGVLERINGLIIDMSGMMLESAAMELLSGRTFYWWESRKVGSANSAWQPFSMTTKKKIGNDPTTTSQHSLFAFCFCFPFVLSEEKIVEHCRQGRRNTRR